MKIVREYKLPIENEFELIVPRGAYFLSTGYREWYGPVMWMLVNTEEVVKGRWFFKLVKTDGDLGEWPVDYIGYLGTCHSPQHSTWHLFRLGRHSRKNETD